MILVFSDLHLGSKQSTNPILRIRELIRHYKPSKVIFAGDTFDLFVSNKTRMRINCAIGCPEAIYLSGNHDEIFEKDILDLSINSKNIHIFHGHQYESAHYPLFLQKMLSRGNELVLRVFKINIHKWIRKTFTNSYPEGQFLSSLYKQRQEIIQDFCNEDFFDIVISGHTHYPEVSRINGRIFANPGNWKHYLVLDNTGNVHLMEMGQWLEN